VLHITDDAATVLERAYDAAVRFNPGIKIRVSRVGSRIEIGFADHPSPGDEVMVVGDIIVFVESGVAGTLEATQPHDRLSVREDQP
jgi:Fe-S cluster assembly iron-binding protein IscA